MASSFLTSLSQAYPTKRIKDSCVATCNYQPSVLDDISTSRTIYSTSFIDETLFSPYTKRNRLVCYLKAYQEKTRNLTSCFVPSFTFLFTALCLSDSTCFKNYYSTFHVLFLPFSKVAEFTLKRKSLFFLYFFLFVSSFFSTCAAYDYGKPTIKSDATDHENFSAFTGSNILSSSSVASNLHFQILTFIEQWGETRNVYLVGGRDYIYMLNPSSRAINRSLPYTERLKWTPGRQHLRSCEDLARPSEECHNFIKIVQKFHNDTLFVCGTNAYAPRCRYYTREYFRSKNNKDSQSYYEDPCKRSCDVPYTPRATAVLLYSNTTQGFRRILAFNGQFHGRESMLLKTGAFPVIFSEDSWFNEPQFIKIIKYKSKAYLFFREVAKSVETGGQATTYGRVAQVCLNDTGGDQMLHDEWTSFLKARLKCSVPRTGPGQEELTFNNLTSVSDVVNISVGGRKIEAIFATFTTPRSWSPVSLSAVCFFTMRSIEKLFETGDFLGLQRLQSSTEAFGYETVETYIKIPEHRQLVPTPRPGTCTQPGQSRQNSALYFIRNHFLMYDAIMPFQGKPLFVSNLKTQMTEVAVDDRAGNTDRLIVYIGTEDGRVLRLKPRLELDSQSGTVGKPPLFLEDMRVMKLSKCPRSSCPVRALRVYRPDDPDERPYLFVAFTKELVRVPLSVCGRHRVEVCCNFDPECGWKNEKCVERTNANCPLPEVQDSGEIPDTCQDRIEGVGEGNGGNAFSQPNQAGFHPLGAGFIGALVAVVSTLLLVFLVHKRRRSKKKKNSDAGQLLKPTSDEAKHSDFTETTSYYLDMEGSRTESSKIKDSNIFNKEGKYKKGNVYTPTTPKHTDERQVLIKSNEKNGDADITRNPTDVDQTSLLHSTEVTSNEPSVPLFNNRSDQELEPPKLPPKRLKKDSSLLDVSLVITSFNGNNNNSTELENNSSTLELPQSKYLQDCDDSETGSISSNPPPFKPPPPDKAKIRRHETFSESKNRSKPLVPPKPNIVTRSASLRLPRPQHLTVEERSHRFQAVPEDLRSSGGHSLSPRKISKTPDSSNPSLIGGSRSPVKGGIPVLPPITPSKEVQ